MAVTDLSDIAAATSAGYKEIVLDRGSNANPATRYEVTLEKVLVGGGGGGFPFRSFAQGSSQAAAETAALQQLNTIRRHRYGGAPGRASGDANSPDSRGATLTVDVS